MMVRVFREVARSDQPKLQVGGLGDGRQVVDLERVALLHPTKEPVPQPHVIHFHQSRLVQTVLFPSQGLPVMRHRRTLGSGVDFLHHHARAACLQLVDGLVPVGVGARSCTHEVQHRVLFEDVRVRHHSKRHRLTLVAHSKLAGPPLVRSWAENILESHSVQTGLFGHESGQHLAASVAFQVAAPLASAQSYLRGLLALEQNAYPQTPRYQQPSPIPIPTQRR